MNPFNTVIIQPFSDGRFCILHYKERNGPAVFATMMIGGLAYQAYSTYQQGKQAAEVGKYQQQQYLQEAEATRQAGQYESREKRKEGQRLIAQQVAQAGAQGGQITGSNLAILAETAKEIEADALMIQHNYDVKATQLKNEGAIAAYQGRSARSAARIRTFAKLGTGLGSMYFMGGMRPFGLNPPKSLYGTV